MSSGGERRGGEGGARRPIVAVLATLSVLAMGATGASAHLPSLTLPVLPLDAASHGLVFDGLRPGTGPCLGAFAIRGVPDEEACTHGPDPAPPGVDVSDPVPVAEVRERAAEFGDEPGEPDVAEAPPVCEGDGESGKRVQAIYARASDKPDRYASVLTSIRTFAEAMDRTFDDSAAVTGGSRRVRFVTTPACQIDVDNVVLPEEGDDTLGNTIAALRDLGYDASDRKYSVWVDANVYCGIAQIFNDSNKVNNTNDGRSGVLGMVARTDVGCWGRALESVEAHELTHNLGGVQPTAPHASANHHCWDEADLMCYDDSGPEDGIIATPNGGSHALESICTPTTTFRRLLDCNSDDYFHTNPAANSYLATRWNVADSSFLIDLGQPLDTTITSASPPLGDPTPTFTFSSNRAAATFECRVDTAVFRACSSPYTSVALTHGPHVFEVRARYAGTTDATPASLAFTLDRVPPKTTITAGPTVTNSTTPTFEFSSNEAGSSFQCKLDAGAWAACSSPHTVGPVTVAQHTLRVRAIDAAGNIDATPAVRTFRVDQTPPQTRFASGPTGTTRDATPTFGFGSSEPSTFECRVDAQAFAPCGASHTTAPLPPGPHTIEARATDRAGNTDLTPAVRSFSVAP
jgi:hypothetical protein